MKNVDQCYIWTAKIVPNVNQSNSPWLVLKRIPAPAFSVSSFPAFKVRDPPNTPVSSPSSSSALSSRSSCCCSSCCCSSGCCSSCTSSPTSCSSSSSSSSPSQSPPTSSTTSDPLSQRSPMGETEKWTCEMVEGHCKIIIRRQLSESCVPRTKTA